ncbi:hypothetical protein L873DRAFT_1820408 [Choiromyces venosus 120613-1]|uniref:Uncharacterized protein n=1 Tax=Choiromyces venosus 120613-1 TaxID=1336337 RepID=A0A3N4J1D0_9PEZI|nr:hypothetical protein L873DRAFT_1820408 [Choiromyces venosus 120613-1]
MGQSGRNSQRPPKPGGAQATAGSSLGAAQVKAARYSGNPEITMHSLQALHF